MDKNAVGKKIHDLLSILTTGNREEVRNAKKGLEKLWHKETKLFQQNARLALQYLSKFDNIKKIENQAAFASGISLFFLALSDKHFVTLKDFTLKTIQHPNGTVREAIRKTADWLCTSLVMRAEPFVYPKDKELNQKQKAIQAEAREQYVNLVKEVEFLIDKYDGGAQKVQYIDEMRPSVNKSLQLFWSRLTESRVYKRIIEQARPVPYEISIKRKDIEDELLRMLKETGSEFALDDIKEVIYNEEDQSDLMNAVAMFDTGKGRLEISNVLETLNDAWNYFPHKILSGLSPAEKILEYRHNEGFYFDNCAICRAMRKAENEGKNLSGEELKQAFAKASNQGNAQVH